MGWSNKAPLRQFVCWSLATSHVRVTLPHPSPSPSKTASAGIRTQTPVASRVGDGTATKQLVTVPMSGGSDRHAAARVFHWVPGKPLVGIATPERLEKMGQLLGTVQNALQVCPRRSSLLPCTPPHTHIHTCCAWAPFPV